MNAEYSGRAALAEDNLPEADFSPATIEALQRRPGFDTAMRDAATAAVELHDGNWILNRLVNDRGRMILGLMVLDLDFTAPHGRGFTAAQLQAEALAYNVCSRGRLTAFLASLRVAGFLRQVADDDRRLRRLVPTERFFALHRARLERHFRALSLLFPEVHDAIAALADPGFLGGVAHAMAETYRRGFRLVDIVPELRAALERDGGIVVLISLMLGDMAGKAVPIATLARRFSVSRAHVLTILREAQQAGLVSAGTGRGGYHASPVLTPTMRRFFAVMFLQQLRAIRIASRLQAAAHAGEEGPALGSAA